MRRGLAMIRPTATPPSRTGSSQVGADQGQRARHRPLQHDRDDHGQADRPAVLRPGYAAPGGHGFLAHLRGEIAQLTGYRPLQLDQPFPDRVEAASGLRVLDVRGLSGLLWPFNAVHDSQCGAPGRVAGNADTRCSTRRSRRQAAIRSVIVTMTPLQVFSKLDGQRRFLAPFLPAPGSPGATRARPTRPTTSSRRSSPRPSAPQPTTARYSRSHGEQAGDLGHSRVAGV